MIPLFTRARRHASSLVEFQKFKFYHKKKILTFVLCDVPVHNGASVRAKQGEVTWSAVDSRRSHLSRQIEKAFDWLTVLKVKCAGRGSIRAANDAKSIWTETGNVDLAARVQVGHVILYHVLVYLINSQLSVRSLSFLLEGYLHDFSSA